MKFTHLNDAGAAYMVDVTEKKPTVRTATACGEVYCSPEVLAALRDGTVPKGDVLLLPLAHTIGVHGAAVDLELREDCVFIEATVRTADRTGVEMEALTAVSVAALAVIDMVKGVDRAAYIRRTGIVAKSGGRSGDWSRELPELAEIPAAE
ncbi:cyclic pyranopterin monophosphate synthase [Corynebacterium phoceense]|uniref:cyclic pyranopterin monophosphate synthase n=1 Tax=Corynebacterium phoceense TaxID=1686286 RepID=UPI000839D490|nr:cyclic pyranopterin monophosphate synthase MoaC [Corynebacterium phoceense]